MRKILDPNLYYRKPKTTDQELERASRLGIVNISPHRTVKLIVNEELERMLNQ